MSDVPAYSTTPAHSDEHVQDFVRIQLKFVFRQRQCQQVHVVQFVPKIITSGQSVHGFHLYWTLSLHLRYFSGNSNVVVLFSCNLVEPVLSN